MVDYDKPLLDKEGKPLKILMASAHNCIRVDKYLKSLNKLGYEVYGLANRLSYGTNEFKNFSLWQNERQFKEAIKMYFDMGVRIFHYHTEPDNPICWVRETLGEKANIIADLHDLDSIRREIIPIPERRMFNAADAFIYVSKPIQSITNELHRVTKPNIVLYSYCNKDIVDYKEEDIPNRKGLIYEGGANPPDDKDLNEIFAYRSLYHIMKRLVEMGNEVHMYCGNVTAYQTYIDTGVVLYPPTMYMDMMKGMLRFKYGILIFNNKDGTKNQVNYTLSNKMQEYLACGIPSLTCWCPESEKYVAKHGIGFTFKDIEEIGNCSQLESKYQEVMNNIKTKRKELVMENFIFRFENLMAKVLGIPGKKVPDNIRALSEFEYGKEDTDHILNLAT